MTRRDVTTAAVLLLVLGACAEAQVPVGTAQLAGDAKLAVRGCGAILLRYAFKGRTNDRSGSAGYRIRAKGPFAPAG